MVGPKDPSCQRIVHVELDESSVVAWSAEIEHERKVAIYDLLEENHFAPVGDYQGPYKVRLAIEENRLLFHIRSGDDDQYLGKVALPLTGFSRIVRDYFTVCESYFSAIKTAGPAQIEALDVGRRSLHDEGSESLRERLTGKIEVDFNTARRLFTLISVLYLRV